MLEHWQNDGFVGIREMGHGVFLKELELYLFLFYSLYAIKLTALKVRTQWGLLFWIFFFKKKGYKSLALPTNKENPVPNLPLVRLKHEIFPGIEWVPPQ